MGHRVSLFFCILLVVFGVLGSSCTIKKHDETDQTKADNEIEIYFGNTGFDAKQYVNEIWADQVVPYIQEKAVPLDILMPALANEALDVSKKYGYRVGEEGTFYNFAVKGRVRIVEINQESRNGLMYVDASPYSGEKEYVLQIGPVFKGTSIRDILDFISLNDFENQVEFARLANEFNFKVRDEVLYDLSYENLLGSEVDIVAVFSFDPKNQMHVMTPVMISLVEEHGGKP
ncbi:MAG: DUF2291 domain-containing protein [Sphaerochaeta sp.]|nr:DUF2291 domain-containing protein [Sphaerochaeta sp.]